MFPSCDDVSYSPWYVAVETSKAVDNSYSVISSPFPPVINNLVPSLLNSMSLGLVS